MTFSRRKDLYEVNWENIAPPYKEYEYFKDCENYPFQFNASSFNLINAWWLIESATLVYAEEDFVRDRFQMAGLPDVRYFSGQSTQCYIASNSDVIIVAFRGTESRRRDGREDFRDIAADVKTDADIRLVGSGKKGMVHKGFNDGLDEVWKELNHCMKDLHRDGRTVWITGHSLGAALATLAAYRYGEVQGLYTYGSPRVGDEEFKRDFHITAYRFENNNDIVCKVPPPGLYCHVGNLMYIDSQGVIQHDTSPWERWKDEARGHLENALNSLDQLKEGLGGLVPDIIKDHVPVRYAIHIWNNMIENKEKH